MDLELIQRLTDALKTTSDNVAVLTGQVGRVLAILEVQDAEIRDLHQRVAALEAQEGA